MNIKVKPRQEQDFEIPVKLTFWLTKVQFQHDAFSSSRFIVTACTDLLANIFNQTPALPSKFLKQLSFVSFYYLILHRTQLGFGLMQLLKH